MGDSRIITNPAGAATLKKYNLNFDKLNKKDQTGGKHYGTTLKPISRNPGKRKNTKKIKNFWNQTT